MNLSKTLSSIFLFLTAGTAVSLAADNATRGQDQFQKEVLPVFNEYCWDCHADGMDKGNVVLDKFKTYADSLNDRKFWDGVREHVSTHVMPPDGKPQPSLEQRDAIVKWISDSVMWVDPAKPDPGHITLRRLNRSEYNNTVRDVFFDETKPANQFPTDDTGYGYDNIGDVLSLSPMLMEKYLRAAHKVSEGSVWFKQPDRVGFDMIHEEFEITSGQGRNEEGPVAVLTTNGELGDKFHVEKYGVWRILARLGAQQCGTENARYAVLVDGKEVGTGEITKEFDPAHPEKMDWQRVIVETKLNAGSHHLGVRFLNEGTDPANPNPLRRSRNLLLQGAEVTGPIGFEEVSRSKFLNWLFEGKKLYGAALHLQGADFQPTDPTGIYFDQEFACIYATGSIHRAIDAPKEGEYTFNISGWEDHAGHEGSKMGLTVDGKDCGVMEVTGTSSKPQEVSCKVALKAGHHEIALSFLNDFAEGKEDRNLYVHTVMVQGPGDGPIDFKDPEFTKHWVARLGQKAMRRPLEPYEAAQLEKLAKLAFDSGDDLTAAVRLVSEAVLSSSHFLFCGGAHPEGTVDKNMVPIDEFSLASRLSYFLWSSCPDEELLALAQKGELRKNLPQQVHRMIADWKAYAFTENFAGQWLQLRDIVLVSPDIRRFPEFNGKIANDMQKESQHYFNYIFMGNRSVLEFLDSDYTFLNGRLAKFYNIPNVNTKADEFVKVSMVGLHRGGVLTQGSILTLTSLPTRTSPVKRGKFLLENILGTPPPPPPQNVPAFKEDRGSKVVGTLRQRFEAHRANPVCASCHAFLDPMGFAFEHFDAVGRYRDQDNHANIDASGQLLTGQKFDGADELRKLLADTRKKEFVDCLAENLLIYALGRGLEYSDKPFKDGIVQRAEQGNYGFQDIIMAVIDSIPFQQMRADEGKKMAVSGAP